MSEFTCKCDIVINHYHHFFSRKYSLSGAYRNILEIPTNLSWKIMRYENKHDDLILSDIDEMKNLTSPQDKPSINQLLHTFNRNVFKNNLRNI